MKINKEELVNALRSVKPGLVTSKEIIEQSASFVFLDGMVSTYNDEVSVSTPVEGIDFTGVVPGMALYNMLSKIKDKEIELTSDGSQLKITGRKFNAGITFQEKVTLPLDSLKPKSFSKLPENFMQAVKLCLFSAGKDMSKPVLTCLHFLESMVESCDNYRVTRTILSSAFDHEALIPANAIQELTNYDVAEYSVIDGWVHFKTKGGSLFSCRTYEGVYPDLAPLIKITKARSLKFPADIDGMLERASVALKDSKQEEVKVIIKDGNIILRGEGDVSYYEERAKIRSEKEEAAFMINPDFLRQILKRHSEALISDDSGKMKFLSEGFEHMVALSEVD